MLRFILGFLFSFLGRLGARTFLYPGFFTSLFLLIFGLIVFCSGLAAYTSLWRANHLFAETQCTISEKNFFNIDRTKSTCNEWHYDNETKNFKYRKTPCTSQTCARYQVDYKVQNQNVKSIAKLAPFTDNCKNFPSILDDYIVGQTYFCWYDPAQPSYVLLYRDHAVSSPIFMALGIFMIFWVIYRNFISPKQLEAVKEPAKVDRYLILEDGRKVSIETEVKLISYLVGPTAFTIRILSTIGVLVGIFLLMAIPYKIWDQWRMNNTFVHTSCSVMDSKLEELQDKHEGLQNNATYLPVFLLSYTVKNIPYLAWSTPFVVYEPQQVQQKKLAQYEKGKSYECWYDPHQPRYVYLERTSYFDIFYHVLIALIVLFICGIIRMFVSKGLWQNAKFYVKPKK